MADQEQLVEEGMEEVVQEREEDPRKAKMASLRRRLQESSHANRRDVASDAQKRRVTAQEAARLERKRQQAEVFQEKLDAEDAGEDVERKRAWDYSIADNEAWDKKLAKKARRSQFEFTDYDDVARRKYKRDIDGLKPDLKSYNAQRNAALGITAGIEDDGALVQSTSAEVTRANEMLYRDANSFVYADHKPSEEQVDKLIHKMNMDADKRNKFSRKRKNEGHQDVTYINEKNRQFNKKLERYFNKYTQSMRDSFERGTAV